MKITVFTSNQPRHLSLINELAQIATEVHAVIESNTVFPGQIADFFKRTEIMQNYFSRVIEAEKKVFGTIHFLPSNVRPLIIKMGDLNLLDMQVLKPALESDLYVVFGSSFIKGDLIEFLVNNKAYNIHMGISPYYRGDSCNFWAAYDSNFHMVGATIHMLSKGLDSGDMLFHAAPQKFDDKFLFGMKAVKCAHIGFIESIKKNELTTFTPVKQNRELETRYSKNAHFTDEVALEFLRREVNATEVQEKLNSIDLNQYINLKQYAV